MQVFCQNFQCPSESVPVSKGVLIINQNSKTYFQLHWKDRFIFFSLHGCPLVSIIILTVFWGILQLFQLVTLQDRILLVGICLGSHRHKTVYRERICTCFFLRREDNTEHSYVLRTNLQFCFGLVLDIPVSFLQAGQLLLMPHVVSLTVTVVVQYHPFILSPVSYMLHFSFLKKSRCV